MKKAQAWLKEHQIEFNFYDYKTKGISTQVLQRWCEQLEWKELVNMRGTTWRKLPDTTKAAVVDQASAIALLMVHTSAIKRPIIEREGRLIALGFSEPLYQKTFADNDSMQVD